MSDPTPTRKPPEVKPWVRRAVEAAGVVLPTNADGERRLGWWGVEMARFLKFCKTLPAETARREAMEGYGRFLKSQDPQPQDWQLDQAREALRCFRKGLDIRSVQELLGHVDVRTTEIYVKLARAMRGEITSPLDDL